MRIKQAHAQAKEMMFHNQKVTSAVATDSPARIIVPGNYAAMEDSGGK